MTEHNPPEEPGSPEPEAIDDSLSDEALLAAAEAPYEPPVESDAITDPASASASAPADETPSDEAGAAAEPPPNQPPPYQPPPYQAPQHQAPTPQRRLFRSRNDRKLGGVAGGLARYLGVDPTVVRIVFVVLALTGTSILIYLAAWVLIPDHPVGQPEPVWRERATDRNLAIAVGLASLGLAVAILNESWLVLAIVLIAGGIWLLSEQPLANSSDWVSPVTPAPTADASTTEYATQPAYAAAGAAASGAGAGGWSWDTPPAPAAGDAIGQPLLPAKRGPQRITRGVLSLLAILAAIGIAASAGDWWDVSPTRMLGIAILTIGAGVLAGAVTKGGARGLIPLGMLATLLLIPVTAVDGLVDDGVGSTTYRPLSADDLQSEYRHGVGELFVDLSRIDLDGLSRTVDIDLGVGELTLILPDEVGGSLDLESKAGELIVNLPGSANDLSVEGINQLPDTIRLPGDRGELTLTVDVGLGVVDIRGN